MSNPQDHDQPKIPIPCLYLPCPEGSSKLVILFHGNAEDLGHIHPLAEHIKLSLKVDVLVPEYPGYGIYQTSDDTIKPTTERILDDALSIWSYFTTTNR